MVREPAGRAFALALSEIDWISSHMELPSNVKEAAVAIYRQMSTMKGRSFKSCIAAIIYAACRECNVPRTLDEVADATGVNRVTIARMYKLMIRELRIRIPQTSPIDLIPRLANKLELSDIAQSKAIELLGEASDKRATLGQNPVSMAAAAIYIASLLVGERRTQSTVADAARVTEVTVRNDYKKLIKKLGIDTSSIDIFIDLEKKSIPAAKKPARVKSPSPIDPAALEEYCRGCEVSYEWAIHFGLVCETNKARLEKKMKSCPRRAQAVAQGVKGRRDRGPSHRRAVRFGE